MDGLSTCCIHQCRSKSSLNASTSWRVADCPGGRKCFRGRWMRRSAGVAAGSAAAAKQVRAKIILRIWARRVGITPCPVVARGDVSVRLRGFEAGERIQEVWVNGAEFHFGMPFVHHALDRCFLVGLGIDQDDVLASIDLVIEGGQLLVLAGNTGQSADPGAETPKNDHDGSIA